MLRWGIFCICDMVTEGVGVLGYTMVKETRKELTDMAAMNINAKQFAEMMQGDKPLLVDYWAPWCTYCRRIGPAYDRVAEAYADRVAVVKVNIDEEAQLAVRERIEVIPTLVLYHRGDVLGSIVAPESKAAIEEFLRDSMDL